MIVTSLREGGLISLNNGIKSFHVKATDVILSMNKKESGNLEFTIIHRGIKLITVNQAMLLSYFNGKYKNVQDAFDKCQEELTKQLPRKVIIQMPQQND